MGHVEGLEHWGLEAFNFTKKKVFFVFWFFCLLVFVFGGFCLLSLLGFGFCLRLRSGLRSRHHMPVPESFSHKGHPQSLSISTRCQALWALGGCL